MLSLLLPHPQGIPSAAFGRLPGKAGANPAGKGSLTLPGLFPAGTGRDPPPRPPGISLQQQQLWCQPHDTCAMPDTARVTEKAGCPSLGHGAGFFTACLLCVLKCPFLAQVHQQSLWVIWNRYSPGQGSTWFCSGITELLSIITGSKQLSSSSGSVL